MCAYSIACKAIHYEHTRKETWYEIENTSKKEKGVATLVWTQEDTFVKLFKQVKNNFQSQKYFPFQKPYQAGFQSSKQSSSKCQSYKATLKDINFNMSTKNGKASYSDKKYLNKEKI